MRIITAVLAFSICCLLAACPVDPERAQLQSGRIKSGIPTAPSSMSFITSFGGSGAEEGKFQRIGGLAALDGRLYVADQLLARIQYFDYLGDYLGSWGCGLNVNDYGVKERDLALKPQAGEDELMAPGVVQAVSDRSFFRAFDIAIYRGDVLVLNNFHSRADTASAMMTPEIIRFSSDGGFKRTYDIPSLLPAFLATDESHGWLGVTDLLNNDYQVFDLETLEMVGGSRSEIKQNYLEYIAYVYSAPDKREQSRLSREWLEAGAGEGQFDFISGLDFYSTEREDGERVNLVLTVDRNNNRIQVFAVEGEHLNTVNGGSPGENMLFSRPSDIAVTADGVVFVTDQNPEQPRVIVLSSRFNPLYSLGHPQMRAPGYIEVSDDGFVFVTDAESNRVFVFGPREEKLAAEQSALAGERREEPAGAGAES